VQISIAMADGGSVTDEELHLYSLNDEGRINRMRHYVDTAKRINRVRSGIVAFREAHIAARADANDA
jgi:hypothetical protein